jgi:class 3 adenylate cyclase/tetratricopeptide (TPR) repeat protein
MAMIACATCARPVPSGSRFCPSCGAPVGSLNFAAEERRVVTVLFADLVGYTSMAERLDPENVKRLIESCFARLVVDIETFGGRVDKVLGDAILALFGAPVAHEDDAERAVRAALRMQDTLAAFVAERGADDPANSIQMRIGINTGEVLVGTLAGSDYTAMGDVVNMASRLQTLAPPGGVLVGNATAALCPTSVTSQPFGVTPIRGREQVEEAWLVTGASASASRPVRCDIPFVGRVDERALLESAINLVRAGHSGLVSIVGEPGSGKSRLADEIVTALKSEAIVIEASCAPYGESSLWAPIRNGLTSLLALEPDFTPDDARTVVERHSKDLWSLEPGDEPLEALLGVVNYVSGNPSELDRLDAATALDRVASVVTDMMRRHAQTRMTVLWVDNLQWADPIVRDFTAVVVRTLADLPFLLITSQRPDEDLAWPPAQLDRPLVLRVPLSPLSETDATALVRAVLEREPEGLLLGDDKVAELVVRGGGNPLFLIEMATLAATCHATVELPGSLRALIAARLDGLPGSRRAIIDNAAVLGASGSTPALRHFAEAMEQEFNDDDLTELAADGLLDIDGHWWRFHSDVVREVAYQTLTKRTRAQRHAGVAVALSDEKEHLVEDLAHHAATAAELVAELGIVDGVPRSIGGRAVHALIRASREAMESGRSEHAVQHASRALDLRCAEPQDERQLLLIRSTAHLDLRRFSMADADARRVLEMAGPAGDRVDEAEARRRIGTAAHMQGDLAGARVELDAALELFRGVEDPKRLANALRARGFAELFGGSLDTARAYLDESLAMYQELGDDRGDAWARHNMAWASFLSGDFVQAEELLGQAKDQFSRLGDRVGVNWAEGLRAYVTYFQRRFDEAEVLAQSVIADAKRWGDTWALLMMSTLLANMRLWSGRLAEAEQYAEKALVGFREAGDRYGIMNSLAPLNRARAGLGKFAEAKRGAEESMSLGHSFGELGLAVQSAAAVAMHLGDGDDALLLADQVLERNRAMGASNDEAAVIRAIALCQVGNIDEALATIEDLEVDDFPFGRSARSLVRSLAGDPIGALDDADAVEHIDGASYFDIALARVGAVLAAGRVDLPEPGEHCRRVEALTSIATSAGDAVFVGIARQLAHRCETAGADAAPPDMALPALREGWMRIVDAVPAA